MRETRISETAVQILLGLSEAPRSGAEILAEIADIDPGREPSVATFYRQLQTLVELGMATPEDADPASSRGGRPGQRFRITDRGAVRARSEALRLQRIARRALASYENRRT